MTESNPDNRGKIGLKKYKNTYQCKQDCGISHFGNHERHDFDVPGGGGGTINYLSKIYIQLKISTFSPTQSVLHNPNSFTQNIYASSTIKEKKKSADHTYTTSLAPSLFSTPGFSYPWSTVA